MKYASVKVWLSTTESAMMFCRQRRYCANNFIVKNNENFSKTFMRASVYCCGLQNMYRLLSIGWTIGAFDNVRLKLIVQSMQYSEFVNIHNQEKF